MTTADPGRPRRSSGVQYRRMRFIGGASLPTHGSGVNGDSRSRRSLELARESGLQRSDLPGHNDGRQGRSSESDSVRRPISTERDSPGGLETSDDVSPVLHSLGRRLGTRSSIRFADRPVSAASHGIRSVVTDYPAAESNERRIADRLDVRRRIFDRDWNLHCRRAWRRIGIRRANDPINQ